MSYTAVETVQFTRIICGSCGVPFMVPTVFYDECQKLGKGKVFYCPNGHGRVFTESTIDRLQKEKEELEHSRFRLQNQLTEKNMQIDVLKKSIVRKDKRLNKKISIKKRKAV